MLACTKKSFMHVCLVLRHICRAGELCIAVGVRQSDSVPLTLCWNRVMTQIYSTVCDKTCLLSSQS